MCLLVELNESGKLIWAMLKELHEKEAVIKAYADYYEIDRGVANQDVNEVLVELEKRGIIEKEGDDLRCLS
ncbi:MAG: PqqD family protein [Bacillota bacterium]|nr:PqqD family protein [Bacillota bacterium]